MFLLWLFCVINSGCINPGAPRNVYQYTEQIHSQFRIFRKKLLLYFWIVFSEYILQFFKRVRWKKDGRLDCQIRWKSTQLADEEYILIWRSILMEHFDKLNLICVESSGILDSKYIPPWSLGSRTPYNMFSFFNRGSYWHHGFRVYIYGQVKSNRKTCVPLWKCFFWAFQSLLRGFTLIWHFLRGDDGWSSYFKKGLCIFHAENKHFFAHMTNRFEIYV